MMTTDPAPPVTSTVLPVPNMSGGVWIWKWIGITSAFSQQKIFSFFTCWFLYTNVHFNKKKSKAPFLDWRNNKVKNEFPKFILFWWNPTPFMTRTFGTHFCLSVIVIHYQYHSFNYYCFYCCLRQKIGWKSIFLLQLLAMSTLNILCLQTKEAFLCPRLSRNSPHVATNTPPVTRNEQCRGTENGYFIYEVQVFALIIDYLRPRNYQWY